MRIPAALAWILIAATFFTSGLLRRFHESTPRSPYVHPAVGSLLFALIVFLLLVWVRERRMGAIPGTGIRLGSVTPILLMLLIEKWVSITLYPPAAWLFLPADAGDATSDALFRALAGGGLLLVCGALGTLSAPARRMTWRTCRPGRLARGLVLAAAAVAVAYAIVGLAGRSLGWPLDLGWPTPNGPFALIVASQAARAFAEELYYRGLLLWELARLAPRLGVRSAAGRRWAALLPVALLFGMEHITLYPTPAVSLREALFAFALAILLGLLVFVGKDLGLVSGLHWWINALLLGAAPRFLGGAGTAPPTSGVYISIALLASFVIAWAGGAASRHARR